MRRRLRRIQAQRSQHRDVCGSRPVNELGHEHSATRQVVVYLRTHHRLVRKLRQQVRMTPFQIFRLVHKVQLLVQCRIALLDERREIHSRKEPPGNSHRVQDHAEVDLVARLHVEVLDLHGNRGATITQHRRVGERSSSHRVRIKLREELRRAPCAVRAVECCPDLLHRARRDIVLQLPQHAAVHRRQAVAARGDALPRLDVERKRLAICSSQVASTGCSSGTSRVRCACVLKLTPGIIPPLYTWLILSTTSRRISVTCI